MNELYLHFIARSCVGSVFFFNKLKKEVCVSIVYIWEVVQNG